MRILRIFLLWCHLCGVRLNVCFGLNGKWMRKLTAATNQLLNLFLLLYKPIQDIQTVSRLLNFCPSRKRLVYGLPYCLLACLAACQVLFAIVRALT